MIYEIPGDLLDAKAGIICHQTNYHGVMGAGVARAIANKLLTAEQYNAYVNYCWKRGQEAVGTVQFIDCEPYLVVANLFSQDETLARRRAGQSITDYEAMFTCLQKVRELAERRNLPIYIPHGMGCGIAGGDWNRVRQLIYSTLGGSSVHVYIVKKG